jgi:hypothetical protein
LNRYWKEFYKEKYQQKLNKVLSDARIKPFKPDAELSARMIKSPNEKRHKQQQHKRKGTQQPIILMHSPPVLPMQSYFQPPYGYPQLPYGMPYP